MKLKYNPHMLIIDQTVRCNEKCFFCWRSNPQDVKEKTAAANGTLDLPLVMFQEIVDQCSKIETLVTFNVCGPMGDPTLVPDIADRGLYALNKGFQRRMMNTNGVALDRHDPKEMVIAYNDMKVSLDTINPEKYIQIHGRDHLDRVLKNVITYSQEARKVGSEFRCKVTVNEKNQDEVEEINAWATKNNVVLIMKRVHSFIDHLPEYGDDIGMKLCEQPYKVINFNFRGELTTCCINYHLNPVFGTLNDDEIKSLWEGQKYENWRKTRFNSICKGCSGLGRKDSNLFRLYQELGEEQFNVRV